MLTCAVLKFSLVFAQIPVVQETFTGPYIDQDIIGTDVSMQNTGSGPCVKMAFAIGAF